MKENKRILHRWEEDPFGDGFRPIYKDKIIAANGKEAELETTGYLQKEIPPAVPSEYLRSNFTLTDHFFGWFPLVGFITICIFALIKFLAC